MNRTLHKCVISYLWLTKLGTARVSFQTVVIFSTITSLRSISANVTLDSFILTKILWKHHAYPSSPELYEQVKETPCS